MDSMIVLMAQHMTVTAIAEMIDEHAYSNMASSRVLCWGC
jgi:hypothetical protein